VMLAGGLLSFATFPLGVSYLVEFISWREAFTWAAVPAAIVATLAAAMLPSLKSGLDIDEIAV
jgi:predicted MFS family arabinose efflux permease